MSYKGTKEKDQEEAKAERPRGFAEMCQQVMSGKTPGCCDTEAQETTPNETSCGCGPEMQGMMARMMSAFQPKAEK